MTLSCCLAYVQLAYIFIRYSVGLSPWLLDILWHLPATKTMHASRDLATSMMRTRMKAERALDYRDLSSYWVRRESEFRAYRGGRG